MRPSAAQPSPCTLRCPRLQTGEPAVGLPGRGVAVERDPQDLAVQAVGVLRVGPVAGVARGHVQVAVRADRQPAAVVVARLVDAGDDRRELAQRRRRRACRAARGCRRRSSRRGPGRRRRPDEPSTATPSRPPSPSGTTRSASWSAPGPVTVVTAPSSPTRTSRAASRSVTTASPVRAGTPDPTGRRGRRGSRRPTVDLDRGRAARGRRRRAGDGAADAGRAPGCRSHAPEPAARPHAATAAIARASHAPAQHGPRGRALRDHPEPPPGASGPPGTVPGLPLGAGFTGLGRA